MSHPRQPCRGGAATFAEVLCGAGYQTLMSGKWHVGHSHRNARPERRGFDQFTGICGHVDACWTVMKNCEVYRDAKILIPAGKKPTNLYHPEKAAALYGKWKT